MTKKAHYITAPAAQGGGDDRVVFGEGPGPMALRTRNPGPLLRPEGMITVQGAGRGDHHQVEVGMGTHLLEVGVGADIELRDGSTPAFSGEGRAPAQSEVIPRASLPAMPAHPVLRQPDHAGGHARYCSPASVWGRRTAGWPRRPAREDRLRVAGTDTAAGPVVVATHAAVAPGYLTAFAPIAGSPSARCR